MVRILLCVLVIASSTVIAFAQDGQTPGSAEMSPWFLAIGSAIGILVTILKKIPFVANNPKLIAGALSIIATGVQAFAGAKPANGVLVFALYAIGQLAAAIGTHEVVVKPIAASASPESEKPLTGQF